MPASPAESAIHRRLFGDDEAARLFTYSAKMRAMLLVEGALARVQGAAGMIPAEAAAFIDCAEQEVQFDPEAMATLAFALARHMPRPEAQALVAEMCRIAPAMGKPLAAQIAARFPQIEWTGALSATGTAAAEARAFAAQVRDNLAG